MDRSDALSTMKEVAAEVLSVDPDQVTEEARFKEDLDADSLDLVELIMGLEERFDITVPEEDLEGRHDRRPGARPRDRQGRLVTVAAGWSRTMTALQDHRGRPRVAITGIGVKTPAGNDARHVLADPGRPVARRRRRSPSSIRARSRCSSVARSRDFDPTAYVGAEGGAASRPGHATRVRGRRRRARRRGRREHRSGALRGRRRNRRRWTADARGPGIGLPAEGRRRGSARSSCR